MQSHFDIAQALANVFHFATQTVAIELAVTISPVDAIDLARNCIHLPTQTPIASVATHLPLYMVEHAVHSVDLILQGAAAPVRRIGHSIIVPVIGRKG